MIRDLSETLRNILDDAKLSTQFKELVAAQVLFDRPADSFKPTQPTVDLFLFDVRENMELRNVEPVIQRNNGQASIARSPLRVQCSYLVTAWVPGDGEESLLQEHRLLSQALMALSRYPTIPPSFFPDKSLLAGQEPPLPMLTAKTEGLKDPADFWSAVGGKLRPSIFVTVTISMQPFAAESAAVVTASELRFGLRAAAGDTQISPQTLQDSFRIAGRVTDREGKAVAEAVLSISSLGVSSTADENGQYDLGLLPQGAYAMRVEPGPRGPDLNAKEVSITVPASAVGDYDVQLDG